MDNGIVLVIGILVVIAVAVIGMRYARQQLPASVWVEVQAAAQAVLNTLQAVVHEDDVMSIAGYIYDQTVLHSVISRVQFQQFVWTLVQQIIHSQNAALSAASNRGISTVSGVAMRSISYSHGN